MEVLKQETCRGPNDVSAVCTVTGPTAFGRIFAFSRVRSLVPGTLGGEAEEGLSLAAANAIIRRCLRTVWGF